MPEKQITIPAVTREEMTVEIIGETPLITHRFGERARKTIEDAQQHAAKSARQPRVPDAEFRDAMYLLEDGSCGFPAAGIMKALALAGMRFADEKTTVLYGVINIRAGMLKIETEAAPRMRSDTVRLAGGTSSIAYRPEFWPWRMNIPVTFNNGIISQEQVLNLFALAGFSVGIGDWRPEKKGTFGTFKIGEVKVFVADKS